MKVTIILYFCLTASIESIDLVSTVLSSSLFPVHFFCPGSYVQASERSFSMVKGGRAREAAALAWERQGATPDKISFKNWAKSVLENPAVVDYKVNCSILSSSITEITIYKKSCTYF